MTQNQKHVATSLREIAEGIRSQRFTRQMLGAMAAKLDGLAVLIGARPAGEAINAELLAACKGMLRIHGVEGLRDECPCDGCKLARVAIAKAGGDIGSRLEKIGRDCTG